MSLHGRETLRQRASSRTQALLAICGAERCEEEAQHVERTQGTAMDTEAGENGAEADKSGAHGNEQDPIKGKEHRTPLKDRKTALEESRDLYEENSDGWMKLNALVQEVDEQIEQATPPQQQPQPETVYLNAVKELNSSRPSN